MTAGRRILGGCVAIVVIGIGLLVAHSVRDRGTPPPRPTHVPARTSVASGAVTVPQVPSPTPMQGLTHTQVAAAFLASDAR
jgi:hypothetical protein